MLVTVYTTSNCVQCMQTKKELAKREIRYDEIALENHPELTEQFKALGHMSAPIVVAGDRVWSGFRLEKIKSLAEELFAEGKR